MFKLTREETPLEEFTGQRHVWPLRVSAKNMDDTDAKIFVMQAGSSIEDLVGDTFSCVASVQQMTELPADAPASGVPYFRVAVFTFTARSADHAKEAWDKIQCAVQDLANNTAAAQVFETVEEVTITPD